ncbi:1-acyl-sn-glycerol-3-phosphate acyltransferase [Candidatus Woesearchaeota archaeon]|jgi:1-acyl-sn-glycerol-3-phosphate acyltransferase|nr:1-acyl-sn-glycerol-3-phosphate acyltransferase [Candidatus Woesearchaeota archaeon]
MVLTGEEAKDLLDLDKRIQRNFNPKDNNIVDYDRVHRTKLSSTPWIHPMIGRYSMTFYRIQKVDLRIEGADNIPKDETVIFAMNHTDRFNYVPFQCHLWMNRKSLDHPFVTIWVKAEYYANNFLGKVLDICNCIPVPSKAYLTKRFFKARWGRKPKPEEYRVIRDFVNGQMSLDEALAQEPSSEAKYMFGFRREIHDYHPYIMRRVTEISANALENVGLSLIIFPEGTRSSSLGKGRTGLVQLAYQTGKKIIPVGCNGSDKVHVGNLPIARRGSNMVYRVGEPIDPNGRLSEFKDDHEAATEVVMSEIENLLDEEYRRRPAPPN